MNKSAEKEEEQKSEKAVSMESEKNSSSRTIRGLSTTIGRIRREIYRRFMSRQLEDTDGNQAVPKITIEKDS